MSSAITGCTESYARDLREYTEWLAAQRIARLSQVTEATILQHLTALQKRGLSRASQGLLDKPTAPMLIIGGALDTQVPIADAYLLLASGDTPKEAWINPKGGHLGRQPKVWPDPAIFNRVLLPWVIRQANGNAAP